MMKKKLEIEKEMGKRIEEKCKQIKQNVETICCMPSYAYALRPLPYSV